MASDFSFNADGEGTAQHDHSQLGHILCVIWSCGVEFWTSEISLWVGQPTKSCEALK